MNQKQLKASAIDGAVRQALVEIHTLKEAGLPPAVSLSLDDDRGLIATKSARIFRDPKGRPQIEWSDDSMRGALLQALTTQYTKSKESEATAEDIFDMETLEDGAAMAEQRLTSEYTSSDQGSAQRPTSVSEGNVSPNEAENIFPDESLSAILTNASEGNVEEQTLKAEKSSPARSKDETAWHKIRFDNEDTKFSVCTGYSFQ